MALTEEEQNRYARHMILEGVGPEGQEKLRAAKVLIVGAGGLGSPIAMYLAAAGVGTIGIADGDRIELSNLQRQILHRTGRIGTMKVDSARETLQEMNPHVRVIPYPYRITGERIRDLVKEYDIVLDAVDNFPAKFMINDACVYAGKPFVHGGILGFSGQLMTYVPGRGPCYRCIFEEVPPKGAVPDCSEVGVMGVLPGIIGTLQALEAIKYILGIGTLLVGKMLIFDGLKMQFRTVQFDGPSPDCKACGGHEPAL